MITCQDSREAKSSWAPRGMLEGQSACSEGGELDSTAHKRVKPRGAGGLFLGTRANCSGCAAFSGSDAVSSLGMGTLTGPSGNKKVLSSGARVIGSFNATSSMLRFNRSPCSSRGWASCGAFLPLQRASLGVFQIEWHTSGWPWPVPPFLHTAPIDNLEFPGTPLGEDSLFTTLSHCVAGTLKAAACQWAWPLTLLLPKCSSLVQRRDLNSLHHSGMLLFVCR